MHKKPSFKNIIITLLTLLPIAYLTYQGMMDTPKTKKSNTQIHILATTSIIADLLKNLVQDIHNHEGKQACIIHTMMKIGTDPHDYTTTIQDGHHCDQADVIFVSGLNLEGTMGHILANLSKTKNVYIATDALASNMIRRDPHHSAGVDPHFWGDIHLVHLVVNYMTVILQQLDPTHALAYAQNAKNYKRKLDQLHQYIETTIRKLPEHKRIIITTHDFLGYLAQRYGLQVHALKQGFSTVSPILARSKDRLADEIIIKKRVKAIFAETSINDKPIQSLVQYCRLKGYHLRISHEPLHADSIGPLHTPAGSYLGMMKHNVDTIVQALL